MIIQVSTTTVIKLYDKIFTFNLNYVFIIYSSYSILAHKNLFVLKIVLSCLSRVEFLVYLSPCRISYLKRNCWTVKSNRIHVRWLLRRSLAFQWIYSKFENINNYTETDWDPKEKKCYAIFFILVWSLISVFKYIDYRRQTNT